MARAKSTARAEARRRVRAARATAAQTAAEDERPEAREPEPEAPSWRSLLTVQRPDVRGDVAAFPGIARTQRTFWLALGAVILATIVGAGVPLATRRVDAWLGALVQLVLYVPSVPLLVAGYFAPRAAWLEGLILGLLGSVGYLAVIFALYGAGVGGGTLGQIDPSQVAVQVTYQLAQGIVFGAIFGGLAAWYRRWLRQSSEQGRRRREEQARQKRRAAKQQARAR